MKLNRKLGAALLVVCMVLSTIVPASAATLNATYSEASYYTIATTAYSRMLLFRNGVVVAANAQKQYGLIDTTGREVVPFQYDGMWALGGNLYKFATGEQEGIVDATGKVVRAAADVYIDCQNETISIYAGSDKTEYFTLTMAPSTSDAYRGSGGGSGAYDSTWETVGGYVVARKDMKYALLDAKQKVVLPMGAYDDIEVLQANNTYYFLVDKVTRSEDSYDRQSALLDSTGKVMIALGTYDSLRRDWRGSATLVAQSEDGQQAVLDMAGKVIVPMGEYDQVGGMNQQGYVAVATYDGDPYAGALTNIVSKLYDKTGAEVKTYNGKLVTTEVYFRDLVFSTDGAQHGVMDLSEKVILPAQFSGIDGGYDNTLVTMKSQDTQDTTYGLYSADGKMIFDTKYTQMSHLGEGRYKLNEGGRYGIMSSATGKVLVPLQYQDMRVHTVHFIEVFDGSSYSILDWDNKVVVPASSKEIDLFGSDSYLGNELERSRWYKEEYDGYTASILPFVMQSASGAATVYADYNTGENLGNVPYAASNINSEGRFVYQGANGLYGFAQTGDAAWATGGKPITPVTPVTPPATLTAYASATTIQVDGKAVKFDAYALKDANGNPTNYLKLRDVASILSGTDAQFQVAWDGSILITTKQAYTPIGSEMSTPFSGDRTYQINTAITKVDGVEVKLDAITLTDDNGDGYTYYKLRDMGQALGFNVRWDQASSVIHLETNKPYTGE